MEPTDKAGQRKIAKGLQDCNLATVENQRTRVGKKPVKAKRNNVVVEDVPRLRFDPGYGKKHDVMMMFVEMMSKGLILETEKRLFELLADQTNLGSKSAIKALYYRCQREYVGK